MSHSRTFASVLWGLSLCLFCGPFAEAQTQKVTLRNCLDPALLTTHEMTVTMRRVVKRADEIEESHIVSRSEVVRAHLDEGQPGQVKVADMIITDPARIGSVTRNGKTASPRPDIESFGLPARGSAQLKTRIQTSFDSPAIVPQVRPADEAVLEVMLDIAHWPKSGVETGHTWSRPFESSTFHGMQHYELTTTNDLGGERVAVGQVRIEGQFFGSLADEFRFDEAVVRFVWIRGERVMLRMEGAGRFRRVGEHGDEPHGVDLLSILKTRKKLEESDRTAVLASLTDFARVSTEFQAGQIEKTIQRAEEFNRKWSDSPWKPAVAFIEDQARRKSNRSEKLEPDELVRAIAGLMTQWEKAIRDDDSDMQAKTGRSFMSMIEANRTAIRKLMEDTDPAMRAAGVFAWSFGRSPAHYGGVAQMLNDPVPRVRAWAAAGLAARGQEHTDTDLLRRMISDADAEVRMRGCLAISRCVSPDEPMTGRLREQMHALLTDESADVRLAAAKALGRVGTGGDANAMREASSAESNASVKAAMLQSIDLIARRG